MIYAAYKDGSGNETASLFYNWEALHRETFCPDTEIISIIPLKVSGKTYKERKEHARDLAVEYSSQNICGLSHLEYAQITGFFENIAGRYGLIKEFKENCII